MENKKYDLEKAKEDCRRHEDALEEAQSCMCGHCHECGFDPSEMKAALDEIGRLQDLIDKPPEEDDWTRDDERLCGEITTDVVQIARKWHSAYRKAQNSNLIRAKEIERQAARIKELEKQLEEAH